jgi:hypothetical protein
MSWANYGNLSCFQSFRTAENTERFDQAYDLFEMSLHSVGFEYVYPGYVLTSAGSSGPLLGIIRAAWRRTSSIGEDIVAIGLHTDQERFDYLACVRADDQMRNTLLLTELRERDVLVRKQMQAISDRAARVAQATRYRRSLKDMLILSPVAIIGILASGTLPNSLDPGLVSSIKSSLPFLPYVTLAFATAYGGLAFYYLIRLALAEAGVR